LARDRKGSVHFQAQNVKEAMVHAKDRANLPNRYSALC